MMFFAQNATLRLGLLAEAAQPNAAPFWINMFPLVLIFVVFYFALIRPQQKKAKEHEVLLKTIKSGDKVVTSGGIVGVVVGLKDKTVSIRSADSKLEVLKGNVAEVLERAAAGSTNSN